MGSAADFLEGAVLDHIFNLAELTPPDTFYVALCTSAPTDSSGGTEVSGGSYARAAVANDDTKWERTGSVVTNIADIPFAQATGAWGTVTHFRLMDALSGGNMWFWGRSPRRARCRTAPRSRSQSGSFHSLRIKCPETRAGASDL